MAGVGFFAQTAEIVTGTAAKTLLQVVAAANQRVLINEISISFKDTVNTDAPILVDVVVQTDAGTTSALTPVKNNTGDNETLQTTARHTATAEPTTTDVRMSEEVHPQTGFLWQAPYGREIVVIGGQRLGVRVTAGASTSAVARMRGDE